MQPDFVHASRYLTSLWFGLPSTEVAGISTGLAALDPWFKSHQLFSQENEKAPFSAEILFKRPGSNKDRSTQRRAL